jgi:Hint domain-containing protein
MSTITGTTISTGITVGTSGNYTSPLTITSTGAVIENTTSVAVIGSITQATVINYGTIKSTYANTETGIELLTSGSVTNAGTGHIGNPDATVVNYGIIIGGVGTVANAGTVDTGPKGVGIELETGTVDNSLGGVIAGYYGIAATVLTVVKNAGTISVPSGGKGGGGRRGPVAVFFDILDHSGGTVDNDATGLIEGYNPVWVQGAAGTIVNHGTILQQNASGSAIYAGINLLNSGTVVDSGTIVGEIYFGAVGANRLVLQHGYSLSKGANTAAVVAKGADNTLELSNSYGAVTVDYNGIGLTTFQHVVFDAGGNETLKVSNTSGTFASTISGLITNTQRIDLSAIGTDGTITNYDTVNNIITVAGSQGTVSLKLDASDGPSFTTISDGGTGTELIACFCRGTLILTGAREVAVEHLAIGDRVMTLSGEVRPIKWIGERAYDRRFIAGKKAVLPIRIAAGALADGVPVRDLFVSPAHAVYFNGVLVPAEHLVNGATITQAESVDGVEYFHIELGSHDIIFADGAAMESYVDCDNRLVFANSAEYAQLYPDDDRPRWAFCVERLEWDDGGLNAIRAALMARAAALGHDLDPDPDLHLIIDGEIIRPHRLTELAYGFNVPAGCRALWLASRSAVPAEIVAESRDTRRLGVAG